MANKNNGDATKRPGYRILRSTVVLAQSSAAITDIINNELSRTIDRVVAVNFDFAQLESRELEVLYGYFDEAFMKRVKDEFIFRGGLGSIRDNGACIATCDLCGKGDSKDEGGNEDHIRFEFCLENVAGGKSVWCGSTCIINFGLKVQGAKTAEEAKRLLEKSLREHKRQWMIEEWQAANPDHESIPNQYQEFRKLPYKMRLHGVLYDNFGELQLANFDVDGVRSVVEDTWKKFRSASRFYQANGFLTGKKQEFWEAAKHAAEQEAQMQACLSGAENLIDPADRFKHFFEIGEEKRKAAK